MEFSSTNINIQILKLNNIDHSGIFSLGTTEVQNRNVFGKKNQGFGQQHADTSIRVLTSNTILDNDKQDKVTKKENKLNLGGYNV
ncbi:hypothetical protein [Niallia circulans]|uniref:hypothetical protein n=1 Tax=Niallia circulans TaxID=1397 RepID=UPI0026F15809|nr:hypothetical protein [Niallia circulans]